MAGIIGVPRLAAVLLTMSIFSGPWMVCLAGAEEETLGEVLAAEMAEEERQIEEEEAEERKVLGPDAPVHKPHHEQVNDFKDCILACQGDTPLDLGHHGMFDLPGEHKRPETPAQRKKREKSVQKLKECAESCHHHVPKFQEHLRQKREKEAEEEQKKQEAKGGGHMEL
mmetsp:Transcript_28357/g.65726  ORF Transcript_28357/g.65726 Transcript_28357/m.65726 type:complete len:169 (-) Transcript_28357:18-524(-)